MKTDNKMWFYHEMQIYRTPNKDEADKLIKRMSGFIQDAVDLYVVFNVLEYDDHCDVGVVYSTLNLEKNPGFVTLLDEVMKVHPDGGGTEDGEETATEEG